MSNSTPKFATAEARADAIKSAECYLEQARTKATSAEKKAAKAVAEAENAEVAVKVRMDDLAALKRSRVSKVVARG